jgi:hypothetical protein
MTDDIKDVSAESSTVTQEQVVNTEPSVSTPDITAQIPLEQGQVPPAVEAVDEFGVPWKNRAFEHQRKSQELAEKLPNLVEQKLKEVLQNNRQEPQKQKYSIAELEQFAISNPNYRHWAEEEKEKIRLEQFESRLESKLLSSKKEQETQHLKQQSEQFVINKFPNMFVKDQMGNIQWNQKDPQTSLVHNYLQDPSLQGNPKALEIASRLAYADIAMQRGNTTQRTQEQLKSQVKSLEKKTMAEGGGKQTQVETKAPTRQAIEKFTQTRSMKDASVAVSEIFKQMGILKE